MRQFVAQSKIKNGVVYVILSHTTAGIMVNESLPCLEKDIEATLEDLVPLHKNYAAFSLSSQLWRHRRERAGASEIHAGGATTGVIPLIDGELVMGMAQDVVPGRV